MLKTKGDCMNTQYCFIRKKDVPSGKRLQEVVTGLGYELKLDPELDLLIDEGFSPCELEGHEDLGYELESGTVDEIFEEDEEFEEHIGERDYYISMSWGSSFADCLAVMITTKALIMKFDAVTTYDCEEPDSLEEIEDGIKECLSELSKGS